MSRLYIFADEAGDFEFSRGPNVSKYFILCTVAMRDCSVAANILDLRRELTAAGEFTNDSFHCATDKQAVRNRVFTSRPRFYQIGWYYHFMHGTAPLINPPRGDPPQLLVTAASIGTGKEKAAFLRSIDDVMSQTVPGRYVTHFCAAAADPCVQVADYCAWAIQRKWERDDDRSYALIGDRITYEFNLWAHGRTHYY